MSEKSLPLALGCHLVRLTRMPVGTVSCYWATHTRNGKGKRRRKKTEETEKNPRVGGGKGRKSRELKNTEKQKDRRISKRNGLSVPQHPQAFGQAADTLKCSCLFFFCSVLDRKFVQRGHVYLCLLLDSVSRIRFPTYEQ